MIEKIINLFIPYGVMGLWTVSLLYEKYVNGKEIKQVVKNNTFALAQNTQTLQQIQKKL